MENVMQGIIDMHIHAAPDVRARKLDDLELMEASVQRGVRAIVLKSHNVPTADRAYLVNRVAAEKYPDVKFTAFGGLCLNHPVGGLNPDAVETSLKLGAKVIWLPTNTAENHYRKNGKDPSKGAVVTRDGRKYTGTVLSKSPSVHVYPDSKSRPRDAENMYVRLDEDVKCAADVRALGIKNGDYICFDTKTTVTDTGFLKSRFIDDKASVACLITAAKVMHDAGFVPENDIKIVFTMYEEVGHGGACMPPVREMLGVDMGCIGLDLSCTEHDVSICAKDAGGPYDYEMTSRLISLAKAAELSYAVDIYPFYGSDIGAMWRSGSDIPGALIGPGVHASHGMERTHFDAAANTVALILLYFGFEEPCTEKAE